MEQMTLSEEDLTIFNTKSNTLIKRGFMPVGSISVIVHLNLRWYTQQYFTSAESGRIPDAPESELEKLMKSRHYGEEPIKIPDDTPDEVHDDNRLFCNYCGIKVERKEGHGRDPKYCGIKCRNDAYYFKAHGRRRGEKRKKE